MVKIYILYYFQKKKTNAMVRIPLQLKGLGFKALPKLYFSFMNEMDENKFQR
jgi:hypothetical protein